VPGFRVPFRPKLSDPDPTGPIRLILRAAITPLVLTQSGHFVEFNNCIVDSGASYTTMSATLARTVGIEFPPQTSRLSVATASSTTPTLVHDGELRVMLPQLPNRIFRLYCVFSESMPTRTPLLFGLNNFFDLFRVTFTGHHSPEAPFGHMLLETE